MKKFYRLISALILLLPVLTGISQGLTQKFELSPSRETDDSKFTVTATEMDNATWCRVEWPDPGSYNTEMAFDDGEADDYFIYANAGSTNALKFITYFDNYIVTGGRIYVGDGQFPGPFLGTSFRVLVYDDDGQDGFPGTVLDSTDIIVNNYGWVEFEGLTPQITEGDFYLAMKQLAPAPNAAPIGVDTDNPTYFRSYSNYQNSGWILSPLQDLMIRAYITGYSEPAREMDYFEVVRFSGFESFESPLLGDTTILDTLSLSEYNDYVWDTLDPGLYAYGVKTHFTGGEWSDYDVSNTLENLYYLSPPSCFYQEDNLLLIACPPLDTNGNIPENLLGLNLYRDMELVGYFSFQPEPPPFPIEIIIDSQPGIYMYALSAIYDLTPYGFPNETGESGYLTTEVVISYGYPLPFLENWDLGSFEINNWLTDGPNWSMTGQEGNPSPSAEFTWDPIISEYSQALESYPLQADLMSEGQIHLDFDLMLDSFNPTGTEEMLVQVWNWDSQTWATVSTYSNVDGSFDWASEHLDITSQAMGTVFKIRFLATGENSLNILGWFVDNIHVYRDCNPPLELEAYLNYSPFGMHLDWESPEGTTSDQWIHSDDGVNFSAVGVGSTVPFDLAARWESEQLSAFENDSITKIAFFPNAASSTYRVRIWIGELAENLIVDQEVNSPVIGEWNTITLLNPVPLDITQDLWVGYQNDGPNGYQMGVDDGPAIDGYGNMMKFGPQWWTLLEINPELDYNWNIQAYVKHDIADDTLVKYAIYRSDQGDPYYLRDYCDTDFYVDDSAICDPLGSTHDYKITAIYSGTFDTCESGFSNEGGDICEGIGKLEESTLLNIYPNPASDMLFIESTEKIESIIIFDSRGITLEHWNNGTLEQWNGETVKIPLNGLASGLYLVRVETGGEMVVRKMVIRR